MMKTKLANVVYTYIDGNSETVSGSEYQKIKIIKYSASGLLLAILLFISFSLGTHYVNYLLEANYSETQLELAKHEYEIEQEFAKNSPEEYNKYALIKKFYNHILNENAGEKLVGSLNDIYKNFDPNSQEYTTGFTIKSNNYAAFKNEISFFLYDLANLVESTNILKIELIGGMGEKKAFKDMGEKNTLNNQIWSTITTSSLNKETKLQRIDIPTHDVRVVISILDTTPKTKV